MKLSHKLSLSFSYFRKHLNRYIFLLISLSIGFAVITVVSSVSRGMAGALHQAARSHYGGDLFIISYDKSHGNKMHLSQPEAVEKALVASGIEYKRLQKRIGYYRDGMLYHDGNSAGQKNVYGEEWGNEDFSHLHIVDGSLDELSEEGSIVISEAVADELECGAGDEVILKGATLTGQKNSVRLIVKAVFRDKSIFGYYKSYTGIEDMRKLLNFEADAVSQYGLYLDKPADEEDLKHLHTLLGQELNTAELLNNKEDLTRQLEGVSWKGEKIFLIPLGIYVSQVDEMLTAMDMISYFLYIMVALIILVSVFISYQLVIRDRLGEIGTLRAIGMEQNTVRSILILETGWLYILGVALGALLTIPGFWILGHLNYDALPGFELFLRQGRLIPEITTVQVILNMGLLALILLPASLIPSYRASRTVLIEALT